MCEVASCLKTYVSSPSFKILEFVENNSTGREMLIVAWLLTFLATFFKSNLCKGTIRGKKTVFCATTRYARSMQYNLLCCYATQRKQVNALKSWTLQKRIIKHFDTISQWLLAQTFKKGFTGVLYSTNKSKLWMVYIDNFQIQSAID